MKKILFALMAFSMLFAACGETIPDGTEIVVPDKSQLNQTVYADNTTGKSGVSFVTLHSWSSTITEPSASRAEAPDWISISPTHGDKGGSYTVEITLKKNATGKNRTATIIISSGEDKITITVTQEAKNEDGSDPKDPDGPDDPDDPDDPTDPIGPINPEGRYITSIKESAKLESDYYSGERPKYAPYSYEFRYDQEKRLKEYVILNADGTEYEVYTYSYDVKGEVKVTDPEGDATRAVLNSKGHIESLKSDDDPDTELYEYDKDGYLTKISDTKDLRYYYTFTWRDGNFAYYTDVYPGGSDDYEATFQTDAVNDKTNLDLNMFFFGLTSAWEWVYEGPKSDQMDFYSIIGLTGNRSKNLMVERDFDYNGYNSELRFYTAATEPEHGVFSESYAREFDGEGTYILDEKGYPTTFVHDVEVVKTTHTYNGGKKYVEPANDHQREEWTLMYGKGPWFQIELDTKTDTKTDTFTYTITYDK